MQKIKENRSKWRENQKKNLEESWGSLTMFDRQQKGRISMDLDGIELCQCIFIFNSGITMSQKGSGWSSERISMGLDGNLLYQCLYIYL